PADPLVSPIKRADLSGLPRALIVTAELDPLRDEGELYGRRLREAGVDAVVSRYPGAGHGFVQHFSWIPEYHRVFGETAAFLKGASGRTSSRSSRRGAGSAGTASSSTPPSGPWSTRGSPPRPPRAWPPRSKPPGGASRTCAGSC